MFYDRLQQELKKSHRSNLPLAMLYLDLDRFKEVNDTYGHTLGDWLLQEIAGRLLDCVRGRDLVARLGGDEFGVIAESGDDRPGFEALAERIVDRLNGLIQVGDIEIVMFPASRYALSPLKTEYARPRFSRTF